MMQERRKERRNGSIVQRLSPRVLSRNLLSGSCCSNVIPNRRPPSSISSVIETSLRLRYGLPLVVQSKHGQRSSGAGRTRSLAPRCRSGSPQATGRDGSFGVWTRRGPLGLGDMQTCTRRGDRAHVKRVHYLTWRARSIARTGLGL